MKSKVLKDTDKLAQDFNNMRSDMVKKLIKHKLLNDILSRSLEPGEDINSLRQYIHELINEL